MSPPPRPAITNLDAGPAPDAGVCLRLLAEHEVGCWFDRRATRGTSLLLVDPDRSHRWVDGLYSRLDGDAERGWPGPGGFAGGWAGWITYEGAVRTLGVAGSPTGAAVSHYPAALVIDHASGRARALGRGPEGAAAAHAWVERLRSARSYPARTLPASLISAGPGQAEFVRQVRRVQEWIAAGETYVANLTYRIPLASLADPLAAYGRLAPAHPAPYAALLRHGDRWVLSSSPELLVARRGRVAWTRPIKGTRPAGASGLAADRKERAELTMIVDMERNDLGRVATTGSVRVRELFGVEGHPGLQHLVATVEAEVTGPGGALLRALLPGGSITGAPKRRTVELLAALEADPRGVYTGALGYCDDGGDMEWSLAIRTLQVFPGDCHYGTGAGITSESDPVREYAETRLKAAGPLRALGLAWT